MKGETDGRTDGVGDLLDLWICGFEVLYCKYSTTEYVFWGALVGAMRWREEEGRPRRVLEGWVGGLCIQVQCSTIFCFGGKS
jgi:hypothetical protein